MANRRRNRQGNGGPGGGRPQHNKATVFDSNGPDVRIRGTAFQIVEKYMTLAKDAMSSGDRVLAENYLQHAEHYQRMIGAWAEEAPRASYYNEPPVQAADTPQNMQADAVVTRPARPAPADDDLGLPASILGAGAASASTTDGNTRDIPARTMVG